MATTLDHLCADAQVIVIQAFEDADGVRHEVGEAGIVRRIETEWPTQTVRVTWERSGRLQDMRFSMTTRLGPGIGRMRDYFERGPDAYEPPTDKVWIEHLQAWFPTVLPAPDKPSWFMIRPGQRDGQGIDAAFDRAIALAARRRFDAAREQLAAIPSGPDGDELASRLGAAAERFAFGPAPEVYEWLRDQAITHWHAWGAQATSGGDGAARMQSIRPAKKRFDAIDAARAQRR